jgi:hypothetical protein
MKKSRKYLRKLIKNRDLFGYPVEFNFNQKELTHNTLIGGLFSILFQGIYFYYLMFLI